MVSQQMLTRLYERSVLVEEASPEKSGPLTVKKPAEPSQPRPNARGPAPPLPAPATTAAKPDLKESNNAETASEVHSTAAESAPSTPGRASVPSAQQDPSTSAPQQVGITIRPL